MPLIYLSGPITGTSAREDTWRAIVRRKLSPAFTFFDPSLQSADRRIGYLKSLSPSGDLERLRHGKFTADRNRHQVAKSDVLLCNLLHTKDRVSIGSVGEIHWANAFNIPIIIIRERQGNIHDHAILNAIASELCFSLDDACSVLTGMFNKGRKRQISQ
jgi:nucleoside 2-deoxyribosyltransferase